MATQIHSIPQRLTLRHANRETLTLTKVLAKGTCVRYMHQKGFAVCIHSAFSETMFCIIGILYVNDTDLFVFAEYSTESVE
jgi:hypothetical protein